MSHWISKNPDYFFAWSMILMSVNFEDKKVLIHGELIECKRGQSLNSLQTWVKIFGKGWTIQRVRTFLNLLKNDSMINIEGLRKTTRLTVCNYELYQGEQQTNNTQKTDKQQTDNTQITSTKEYKEIIEELNKVKKEFEDFKNKSKEEKKVAISKIPDSEFKTEKIKEIWQKWIQYKKEQFNDTYKSEESELTAFNKLRKLSKSNHASAEKIVDNSIANLWKGLFKLDDKENEKDPNKRELYR